jgi:glucose/arabinose dehydrogenase
MCRYVSLAYFYRIPRVVMPAAFAACGALFVPALSSAATLAGDAATTLDLATYASGLSQPTDIAVLADGRAVITQRLGDIIVRTPDKKTVVAGHLSVHPSDDEQGLLGVVPDPNFASNKALYFYADIGADVANRHQVLKIVLGDDNKIGTQTVIIGAGAPTPGILGPQNHNGGGLQIFDNHLYVSVGDTGHNATPPVNRLGTCLNSPNGKILRLNLDGTIPTDNPLYNSTAVTGCDDFDEALAPTFAPDKRIWAWGLRNPFRFWIDPREGAQQGTMWIGDVGETTREEVSVGGKGQHFGWPFVEGTHAFSRTEESYQPAGACMGTTPATPCVAPVYDYAHDNGNNCIIGGLIPDGCGWSDVWKSRYIFGDNGTGNVWTIEVNPARSGASGPAKDFGKTSGMSAFRMGADSALYIVEVASGSVQRVTPKGQPTSCVASDAGVTMPDGGPVANVDASLTTTGGVGTTGGAGSSASVGASSGAGGASSVATTGTGATTGTAGEASTGASGDGAAAAKSSGCGCRSGGQGVSKRGIALSGALLGAGLWLRRRSRRRGGS